MLAKCECVEGWTSGGEVVKASVLLVGFRVHLAGFVYASVAFFLGLVGLVGFVEGVDAAVSAIENALVAGPLVGGTLDNSLEDAGLYGIVVFTTIKWRVVGRRVAVVLCGSPSVVRLAASVLVNVKVRQVVVRLLVYGAAVVALLPEGFTDVTSGPTVLPSTLG